MAEITNPAYNASANGVANGTRRQSLEGWVESMEEKQGVHAEDVTIKLAEVAEDAPIEEVELTVPRGDDPSLPVWTFRMWILGLLVCAILAFLNQFFAFRAEPLTMTAVVAQIVTLPMGHFMARTLPTRSFSILGQSFSLNPGPFNMKEHVLITVFANCGANTAYAIDVITIMKRFYHQDVTFGASFLLVFTSQCLGYSWAGLLRKTLVEPAHFWWPSNLVTVSLLRAMHEDHGSGRSNRLWFFTLVSLGSFLWYLVPGYFFTIAASVSWLCWTFPDSVTMHQLGGGLQGLGLGSFSLDWATVTSFLGSPLATPWHVIVNVAVGFVGTAWVIMPLTYWGFNFFGAKRFPIVTQRLYTEAGKPYPTLSLLTSDLELNDTRYSEVGPPRMSAFFATSYALGFAALTAALSHVLLWHGKDIWQRTRAAVRLERADHHTRLMRRYPNIPAWWFAALLIAMTALSIWTMEVLDFQLPWWGVLLATVMAAFFTLPVGILASTTNQVLSLNILTEMLAGYILPGEPVANVAFKVYGFISMTQAVTFLSDFKLGHYTKIPPRAMFLVQVVGTVVAGLVNVAVAFWLYRSVTHICDQDKLPISSPWTCPSANTFFSASVIWGVIGPQRMFGALGEYRDLNWCFVIGFLLPFFPFFLLKAFPRQRWLRLINMPIILGATSIMPPASSVNFTSWILVGFIFQFVIFRYRPRWWARYNYVTSAGLDTGVALMGLVIFVLFQSYWREADWNLAIQSWWANSNRDQCPLAECPTASGVSVQGCPPFWESQGGVDDLVGMKGTTLQPLGKPTLAVSTNIHQEF